MSEIGASGEPTPLPARKTSRVGLWNLIRVFCCGGTLLEVGENIFFVPDLADCGTLLSVDFPVPRLRLFVDSSFGAFACLLP